MDWEQEDYDYSDHGNSSSNDSYHDYDEDYHSVCDKEAVRSFARLFLPVAYALALVVGLAGNGLVVAVYAAPRRLRTLTDVCILNLAVSDLLLLLTLPFWAADAVRGWTLGEATCKLTAFLYAANFSCGMLLLACIGVDRYRSLAHCATGRAGTGPRARRRWWLVVVLIWTVAGVLGLPDLVLSRVKHHSTRVACTAHYPPSFARPVKAALELVEVSLSFLLPFLVMVVCYCWVGRALSRVAGVQREKKWRALRVLLAMVAVFLLTQLPYNMVKLYRALDIIYALVTDCELSKGLDRAVQLTKSLALTHTCVNPLLYAFIGSTFRGHVLRAGKRFGQRLGGRLHHVDEEPALEIALNTYTNTHVHSHSVSQEEDTSTFTI